MIYLNFFLFIFGVAFSAPDPTEDYLNKLIIKEPDLFYLYWNYNDTDILIETHAKTTGWSAFGLSPTGGMDNSDVVVSWINIDGSFNFSDRHIRGREVLVDKVQNWFPISVFQKDDYIITKFTRKIKICDETNEDLDIEKGTPMTIFAYGTVLVDDDIGFHGSNRGTRSVPLISSLNLSPKINLDEVERIEYRTNYTFDGVKDTEYHCSMFKLPDDWVKKKRHLIRYETLFTPGTEENLHHWVINECEIDFERIYLKNNSLPTPGFCYSEAWLKASRYCRKVSLVWAVGGSIIQDFPEDLAYPLGGSELESKYFYFEIHYNNPKLKKGIDDHSGVRLYTTKNYRKTEFGVFTIGTDENFKGLIIPPRAESFKVNYDCTRECTDHLFEEHNEIKVFSTMPHTHLSGREIYTKVVRDGKEIAYLTNNKYYDFNYQYYNFLSKPVTLKKGDELITKCVYNTRDKTNFTYGGFSTYDEMCFNFLWYYPRTSVSMCMEWIDENLWIDFLKKLKNSGEIEADINLTGGIFNRAEKNLNLKVKNPSQELIQKFEDFHNKNEKIQVCVKNGNLSSTVNNPLKSEPLIDESCPKKPVIMVTNTTSISTDYTTNNRKTTNYLFSSASYIAFNFKFVLLNYLLVKFSF